MESKRSRTLAACSAVTGTAMVAGFAVWQHATAMRLRDDASLHDLAWLAAEGLVGRSARFIFAHDVIRLNLHNKVCFRSQTLYNVFHS